MGWMPANIRCDHTKGRDGCLCPLILPYSHLCVNAPLIHFQNSAASFNGPGWAGVWCVYYLTKEIVKESKIGFCASAQAIHSGRLTIYPTTEVQADSLWIMNHDFLFPSREGAQRNLAPSKIRKYVLNFQKGLMVGHKSCRKVPSAQRIIAVMSLHVHCTISISFSAILCSVPTGGASGQL